MLTTEGIKAGDVLKFWYDTGCFGYSLVFATVVKPCPKMLRVRLENGNVALKPPQYFIGVVDAQTVAGLRADGVNI